MENQEKHICENCGKEHNGSYGSGRFCSDHCRRSFNAKKVKKVKNHICNLPKPKSKGNWECKCGQTFLTRRLLNAHKHCCNFLIEKKNQKLKKEKQKIRKKNFKRKNCAANYSIKACEFINDLNEMFNINLQHAMNGGEINVCGFFIDGFDKKLNIAFEYDERSHYIDVKNNILHERDIKRMNFIHTETNCRFFRYNEKENLLYEVTKFDKLTVLKSHILSQEREQRKLKNKLKNKKSQFLSEEICEYRKNLILNCGVDLTKFGWVCKVANKTKLSIRQIELIVKKCNLQNIVFIRKK